MREKIRFIVPSIITLVILLVIFYFQGLYPFTDNSIVQVDADYQFIPVLYRIYDFLHGNGNIIYDDIGFGNNIYISMIIQGSIFSPVSLLLYFTSRDNIINYFNIIVIVKMCLLSLTTYVYINKTFKISEYYKIVFSVLYAFSGWMLLNYFNIMWVDCVILFPLLIMFLNELLDKGKYLGYVITLSLSLVISYYISYFILLFVLFYSFLYIFLKLKKYKVKETIFKLGIATVISFLISSFSVLPAVYQTFLSSRLDSTFDSVTGLFNNFINKSLFLMMSSIFIVFFISLLFKYIRDKKNIYFYVILFILFGIGMIIEPINLGLHMGSYWSFPYRYSFITLFILMTGSLYFISKFNLKGFSGFQIFRFILFILFVFVLVYINNLYLDDIIDSQIVLDFNDFEVYTKIFIVFLLIILMTLLSMSFKNKKLRFISFSIVCLLQIFVYSSWTMYYSDGYFLTKRSNTMNNELDIIKDDLERYKMGYVTYTPDHGFIYDVNTLDNWLHILPTHEVEIYGRLGYGNSDTCLRSYGGTIFTDWLFNVGYLLDDKMRFDDKIYSLLNESENFYLYEYMYDNGFGFVYNKDDNQEIDENLYKFDLQNEIYRDLINEDKEIIKIDYFDYTTDGYIKFDYNINELGFLYIDLDYNVDYILVNDEYVEYDFFTYIIDLGMYSDDVSIEIGSSDLTNLSFSLGFISYKDIMELKTNVDDVVKLDNGYDISVNNNKDNGYLFVPINNISGLKAYVNDREVDIDSYMNNFVSIKLDNGDNIVKIRYEMPLFKIGIILSIVGVVCLLLFKKIPMNNLILNVTYYVYIFVCLLFYLYLYGYSLIKYYRS